MFIKLNDYEIETAILDYLKKEAGFSNEILYHEIFATNQIKKDVLLTNQSAELEVFIEFKEEE